MSTDVTVNLPDAIRQCAEVWASQSGRSLPDFLAETIELSLLPLGEAPPHVDGWTDGEVLAAADAVLSPDNDQRLSELLDQQREAVLDAVGRRELMMLMQGYQEGLVRKAAATQEAVRRGLRAPVSP